MTPKNDQKLDLKMDLKKHPKYPPLPPSPPELPKTQKVLAKRGRILSETCKYQSCTFSPRKGTFWTYPIFDHFWVFYGPQIDHIYGSNFDQILTS